MKKRRNSLTNHCSVYLQTVPLAIISARFTKHIQTKGRWLRSHIILNTFTVIFITIGTCSSQSRLSQSQDLAWAFYSGLLVVFTLGYFAVGTSGNIFDNVHHRIGLTIFVAILLQFLFGLFNSFILLKPHACTPFQNRIRIVFGMCHQSVSPVYLLSPLTSEHCDLLGWLT